MPHAGTWIEIPERLPKVSSRTVVPHAGTWIEIRNFLATLAGR